jgi:hypothetical protein
MYFVLILIGNYILDNRLFLLNGISKSYCLLFLKQIESAQYSFPPWFSGGAKSLIRRILDPHPDTVSLDQHLFRWKKLSKS